MLHAGESPRLLCVDDQVQNLALLKKMFPDCHVTVADCAARAWQVLFLEPPPDLILMDVMMPDENGFSVCQRIKEDAALRDIPIIFLTGVGGPEFETQAFEVGAVDYITKPFNVAVVRARVNAHLALKAAREQVARQNLVLETRVAERTSQLDDALKHLSQASLETTVRLARAAEYRDELTGAHVLRVSYYAEAIARQLGMADGMVGLLLRAAAMHDVGKIAIPDHILLKPGPLTAEEWEIMKQHTVIGASILAGSEFDVIKLGETVARTHHERWDGGGYPSGLKDEGIPIAGRIVAMADLFDGSVSRRPYKPPKPLDVAFELVREERGAALDPQVVDAFFAVESEILEIKATYEDRVDSPLVRLAGIRYSSV